MIKATSAFVLLPLSLSVLAFACAQAVDPAAPGTGGSGGSAGVLGASATGGGGGEIDAAPVTPAGSCEAAAAAHSYEGCEFWPTVVANNVWSVFDFAVVVANAGDAPAEIQVHRSGQLVQSGTVAPGSLTKLFLPWIPELKGGDADECGNSVPLEKSVRAPQGAYRLTSSAPVTVYQFNALEYRGEGGPGGKSWDTCPGAKVCNNPQINGKVGCFSFSNDASLLLPTSALSGTYRVVGQAGWAMVGEPSYFAITGTQDDTQVTVKLAENGEVVYGNDVPGMPGGLDLDLTIGRGEVVELVGAPSADFSGSLVKANKPVQVISGMPCVNQPADMNSPACDHIEESVFPAETLGNHYFVTVPTSPSGKPVGHFVRLVGNVDGTKLDYPGATPLLAPTTLDAGQVVDLGLVTSDFELVSDQSLAVVTFQLGGSLVDSDAAPQERKGDPSQSAPAPVEQFRKHYVFLAPDDYDVSYVDIVMKAGSSVSVDGAPMTDAPTPVSSGWSIARVKLGAGQDGAHTIEASEPVGVQVVGYGRFTSYQYPGGLDLSPISQPPVR
jgi:IgGFc binding protein